jgi:TRAP-type C4-dicarboxylate transport system substrate-binding protein
LDRLDAPLPVEHTDSRVVRLAGYQGMGSILTRSLLDLAKRLGEAGGDAAAWQVETTADVTAGGEAAAAMFRTVEAGQRHIGYVASGYLCAMVPELAALDLPLCVTDRCAALDALDGTAGVYLAGALERRTGYKLLGFWDNGFRNISNRLRPIRCAADCAGMVVRTLDSAGYREALQAMGFIPRSTDVKDLLRVVQTNEVDAQENPLTNTVNFGIWRYHPHVSLTGHFFGVLLLVCNRTWFMGLAAQEQDAVLHAARETTRLQRALAASEDSHAKAYLAERGVQVVQAGDIDLASMQKATRHIVDRQRMTLPPELLRGYLDQVMT